MRVRDRKRKGGRQKEKKNIKRNKDNLQDRYIKIICLIQKETLTVTK